MTEIREMNYYFVALNEFEGLNNEMVFNVYSQIYIQNRLMRRKNVQTSTKTYDPM